MRLTTLLNSIVLGSLLSSGCAHVRVPDTEACAVKGLMRNGAHCNHTLTEQPREMNLDEFITFLEASESEQRGAAICQSAGDWSKMKAALEQACYLLKRRCTYEMLQAITHFGGVIERLSSDGKQTQAR